MTDKCCPKCGSYDYEQTIVGVLTSPDNINAACCLQCGWTGRVSELTDPPEWESSVLRCFDDPEHCQVCAFIDGSRKVADLMEVIRVLDLKLAQAEILTRTLAETMRVAGKE